MSPKCAKNEIRLVRVYDAKIAEVWDAFTDLQQILQWWGPRGFSVTSHKKDLRPGGSWDYTMHGPDGTDYPNKAVYYEVEKQKFLRYDHGANDVDPPLFQVKASFSEGDGKTTLDMTFVLANEETAIQVKGFIHKASGNTTWDRLAEFLRKRQDGAEVFVINHSFDASPKTVFKMWTSSEHLSQWLPPSGFKMEFLRSKIAEGQSTFYRMFNTDGLEFFGRTHYLYIEPNQKIVMRQEFCDKDEAPSRHPLAKDFPQTMLSTVLFAKEDDGTRVTLTTISGEEATAAEIARFAQERSGMSQGWGGSLDTLEELFKKSRSLDV